MLAFRSEGELDGWLQAKPLARGAVIAPQTLYDLGQRWYRGRLQDDWEPFSTAEKQRLLTDVGLVGDFWRLE